MQPIIKTKRLYLREFQPSDAEAFYAMNVDPEVIRYTGDEPFKSVAEAREFLKNYSAYSDYGYGRWAVCLNTTGQFIGFCGLKYHPEEDLTEVGFRIIRSFWNKGYATESAIGCLTYGFKTLGLKQIYAHVHVDNTASCRVLEKLGLKQIKRITYDGNPAYLYCLDATKYE